MLTCIITYYYKWSSSGFKLITAVYCLFLESCPKGTQQNADSCFYFSEYDQTWSGAMVGNIKRVDPKAIKLFYAQLNLE